MAHLGVENVCFPSNCHQNQYVGEISYGLTFPSILGSILAPFWRLWAAIWRHLGCPGRYGKVGDIWRDSRRYLERPGSLAREKWRVMNRFGGPLSYLETIADLHICKSAYLHMSSCQICVGSVSQNLGPKFRSLVPPHKEGAGGFRVLSRRLWLLVWVLS